MSHGYVDATTAFPPHIIAKVTGERWLRDNSGHRAVIQNRLWNGEAWHQNPGSLPRQEKYHKAKDPDQDWYLRGTDRARVLTDGAYSYFPDNPGPVKKNFGAGAIGRDHSRRVFKQLAHQRHSFSESNLQLLKEHEGARAEMAARYAEVMGKQSQSAAPWKLGRRLTKEIPQWKDRKGPQAPDYEEALASTTPAFAPEGRPMMMSSPERHRRRKVAEDTAAAAAAAAKEEDAVSAFLKQMAPSTAAAGQDAASQVSMARGSHVSRASGAARQQRSLLSETVPLSSEYCSCVDDGDLASQVVNRSAIGGHPREKALDSATSVSKPSDFYSWRPRMIQ
eukprot:gnl/TRDRNA2_/TRDRNA2_185768_c0_seq1.p1 gnl/TRDRNA2_/TRDRNA2_185768_c0~~gnl/TRDRNA2_/TRDRNA2_185768_c0_seq1.p1  ORF type:complete len:336 (+),score=64.63 gnl/TRDRNA2_/TRDRNA2_185768_c0_seq1:97-1104(+)